jgi:hypothetical protein
MKKLISAFFMLGLGFTASSQTCPTPATSGVHVTLDSTYQIGKFSDGVTDVGLCFYNSSSENITAVQFRLFYDTQGFASVNNVTSLNTSFPQDLQYVDNAAGGYLTITLTYTGTLSTFDIPDGPLFKVQFNHTSALSTTYFNITDLTFVGGNSFPETATNQAGNDYALNLTNFGGAFSSQKFTFGGRFINVTGTPAKQIGVKLEKQLKSGGSWATVTTDVSDTTGRFRFEDIEVDTSAYNVRIAVQGDTLSVGNIVTTSDAQRVNQYVLGTQSMTGFDYYTSDVNGDNNITISDVYGIYARISGRFSQWANSVPDVKFFTESEFNTIDGSSTNYTSSIPGVTNFTFNLVAGQPDSVTYYVAAPGDANGTGFKRARLVPIEIVNPNNANLHIIDVTTDYDNVLESIEVNFPTLGVDEGSEVRVPVKVLTGGKTLGSLQLSMKYDSDLLEFTKVENELKSGYWISFVNAENNEIEWGGYDPTNNTNLVNDNEIIFTLVFNAKVTQNQWNKSPLYVTRKFAGDDLATDLIITPTDGILQIFKTDDIDMGYFDMIAFPNPTQDVSTLKFKVYEKSYITLGVYDLGGKKVIHVIDGTYDVGIYNNKIDLGLLPAGEYVAILRKENDLVSERVTKIK